jgi:metal-sulfur cluster biosynthetic enzyme
VSEETHALVVAALNTVYDPCSVAASVALSVVEMGLVRECSVDELDVAHITLTATNPFCTLIGSIMAAVEAQVAAIPAVQGVEVKLDTNTFWSEASISASGRSKLESHRERSRRRFPVAAGASQHDTLAPPRPRVHDTADVALDGSRGSA